MPTAASAFSLRASVGTTGSTTATICRWRRTSSRNSVQPGHAFRCRRSGPRRSEPPRSVASCSRISSHGVSRACAALDQPRARLEDERLHLCHLALDDLGHLGVREVAELGEDERGALVVGQLLHVGEQLLEVGALLDLLAEALRRDPLESSLGCSRRARRIDRQRLRAIV